MLKSRLIALFAFLCISVAQAVIVKVDILKGKNPKTGKEQYVYLLGDMHNNGWNVFDYSSKSREQKNALYDVIEQYSQEDIKMIIENRLGIFCKKNNFLHLPAKLSMKLESFFKQSLLYLFGSHCENKGLDVANIDIRDQASTDPKTKYYCKNLILCMFAVESSILLWKKRFTRIAFLGATDFLLLKYLDFIMPDIDLNKICTHRLKEIDKLLKVCGNKDKSLKSYYQGVKKRLQNQFDDIFKKYTVPNNKYSFDALMKQNSFDKHLYWDILLFDKEIIDAKAIHEVVESGDKSTVFVFLGAYHTFNIKPILEHLGYRTVFSDMSQKISKNKSVWDPLNFDPYNAFDYYTLCKLLSPKNHAILS